MQPFTHRRAFVRVLHCAVLLGACVAARPASAQGTPIDAMLSRGRRAVIDFRFGVADSLAREVLKLGGILTQAQRIAALQLGVAAAYPEDASSQRTDSAYSRIRQLLALGASAGIPRDLSWPGLDSVFNWLAHGIRSGKVVLGSRVPGAALYVNGAAQRGIQGLRTVELSPGVKVQLSIRASNCVSWDSTVLVNAADSLRVGYRNPACPAVIASDADVRVAAARGSVVVNDFLTRAQQALNSLDYARADSLARQALEPSLGPTASQRALALLIDASAKYPEEPARQRRASALIALREVVRTNLGITVPAELTWPGLDSLVDEARRTSFGVDVTAELQQEAIGPEGAAVIHVRANRAATFHMSAWPVAGGSVVAADSAGPTMADMLQLHTMRAGRPALTGGDYHIRVTAVEVASHDTVSMRFRARVQAPAFELVSMPAALDSTKLRAASDAPLGRNGSILIAAFVGGATYALASVFRADGVKGQISADSKGILAAAAFAGAIITGGLNDHGRPRPDNVAWNQGMRNDFANAVRAANAQNSGRLSAYRVTIQIEPEVP